MHYRVPLTAGLPLCIYTIANVTEVVGALDTALSVFDVTGLTLLATDDDAYPRSGTDSALIYRSLSSGFVCVRVEDFSSWAPTTPVIPSPNQFTFGTNTIGATGVGTLDQEPNDTGAGQSTPISTGVTIVAGVLDTASDVDTYTVVAAAGTMRLNVSLPPMGGAFGPGVTSFGSSLSRFVATVRTTGNVVLGQLGPVTPIDATPVELEVPIAPGTYRVAISRPSGSTLGSNDFYGATVDLTNDYPNESEVGAAGTNDSKTNAEVLALVTSPTNPKVRTVSFMGHLPPGDASDYFKFTAITGSTAEIVCTSARRGSGLTAFTVALLSNTTTPVKSELEVSTADLHWGNGPGATSPPAALVLTGTGSYYFRFTSPSRSGTNTGDYYRCDAAIVAP